MGEWMHRTNTTIAPGAVGLQGSSPGLVARVVALAALILVAVSCGGGDADATPDDASAGDRATETPAERDDDDESAEGETTASSADPVNLVAYVHEEPDAEGSSIYLLDLSSGDSWELVPAEGSNEGPSISPDATTVTFESDRTGDWELYMIGIDGENLTRLTDADGQDSQSDWSPDGTQLAFESERDGDFEIYVLDIATQELHQLTDNDDWDGAPVWSPDGTSIAFHSDRGADPRWNVYVMADDGSDAERRIENALEPEWSPDGRRITYDHDPEMSGDDRDIWISGADGSDPRPVVEGAAWQEGSEWLPDGSAILLTSDRTGTFHLHSVRPDGSDLTELTTGTALTYEPSTAG
jgi:Tol biopolymer transport system component